LLWAGDGYSDPSLEGQPQSNRGECLLSGPSRSRPASLPAARARFDSGTAALACLRRRDGRYRICLIAAARSLGGNTALVDRTALLDLVTEAVARARNHEGPTEWDREAAGVALRRWQSFDRRHKTDSYEARIHDLARGLLERLDPERMDEPGWHVWTAEAAGEVLRERLR
jgi:hypothetical protein